VVEQRNVPSQGARLEPPSKLQQGWPALPQGMQVLPLHVVPLPVQNRELQQG
jgi:hypothetical protein